MTSEQVRIPSREEYLLLAKVAEEAERYEGAVDLLTSVTDERARVAHAVEI